MVDLYPSFDDLDPSGSFGSPDLPHVDVVLLGDSSNTGPGLAGPDEIWARQVMDRIGARFHVELVSVAKGGAKAKDVATQQVPLAAERKWHVALVSVGANDALKGTPARVFRKHMERVVDGLLDVAGTVVLSGVGDLGAIPRAPGIVARYFRGRGRMADKVHRGVAAERDRVFKVPMWERSATPFRQRPDIWASDGFHPNRRGHKIWADAAWPVILAAIEAEVGRRR